MLEPAAPQSGVKHSTTEPLRSLELFFSSKKNLSGIPPESQPVTTVNSLDPDQARHIVGPDLGPNCLQSLSTDDFVCLI